MIDKAKLAELLKGWKENLAAKERGGNFSTGSLKSFEYMADTIEALESLWKENAELKEVNQISEDEMDALKKDHGKTLRRNDKLERVAKAAELYTRANRHDPLADNLNEALAALRSPEK